MKMEHLGIVGTKLFDVVKTIQFDYSHYTFLEEGEGRAFHVGIRFKPKNYFWHVGILSADKTAGIWQQF